MFGTVIDHAPYGLGVVARVFGRTPDAGNTKLTAAAVVVVIGTINAPPCVATAHFDRPSLFFCVPQCGFNIFVRMRCSFHHCLQIRRIFCGCQVTTAKDASGSPQGRLPCPKQPLQFAPAVPPRFVPAQRRARLVGLWLPSLFLIPPSANGISVYVN